MLHRMYRLEVMTGYNPTRRNRNIGTRKSGHGQNNRLSIPQIAHGEHIYWERIDNAQEVVRVVANRDLRFFVQPTRSDCVHSCTVDDLALLMSHVPSDDWEGLDAIVLRQPRRKEETIASVWGRLAYAADLVNQSGRNLYSGPAIILEAVSLTRRNKFGRSLTPDDVLELERLRSDGHSVLPGDKNHSFESTLESCRATQLYRTLLHELGHWVDFLQKVEKPAATSSSRYPYPTLLERFHSRPDREKEEFAHSYADRLRDNLRLGDVIPFDRQFSLEQISKDKLRPQDFSVS